jgi:hypothetical protein
LTLRRDERRERREERGERRKVLSNSKKRKHCRETSASGITSDL